MNRTFLRKAVLAGAVLVLGSAGFTLFGGTAFADNSSDGEGGTKGPAGTAKATCVAPPLAVGVALIGQNAGEPTQCSVKKNPPPESDPGKNPPAENDTDAGSSDNHGDY